MLAFLFATVKNDPGLYKSLYSAADENSCSKKISKNTSLEKENQKKSFKSPVKVTYKLSCSECFMVKCNVLLWHSIFSGPSQISFNGHLHMRKHSMSRHYHKYAIIVQVALFSQRTSHEMHSGRELKLKKQLDTSHLTVYVTNFHNSIKVNQNGLCNI